MEYTDVFYLLLTFHIKVSTFAASTGLILSSDWLTAICNNNNNNNNSLEGSAVEVVLCLYWSTFPCKSDGLTLGRIELHQPVLFPLLATAKAGLECVGVMHGFDGTVQQAVISKHPNCGTNSTWETIDKQEMTISYAAVLKLLSNRRELQKRRQYSHQQHSIPA